jgi:hypothetical protein
MVLDWYHVVSSPKHMATHAFSVVGQNLARPKHRFASSPRLGQNITSPKHHGEMEVYVQECTARPPWASRWEWRWVNMNMNTVLITSHSKDTKGCRARVTRVTSAHHEEVGEHLASQAPATDSFSLVAPPPMSEGATISMLRVHEARQPIMHAKFRYLIVYIISWWMKCVESNPSYPHEVNLGFR